MLTIEPRMVTCLSMWFNLFLTHVFLVSILRSTPNYIPLKNKCPNCYCVGIKHAIDGISTKVRTSKVSSLLESLFIDRVLNSGDLQFVPMYFFPAKI